MTVRHYASCARGPSKKRIIVFQTNIFLLKNILFIRLHEKTRSGRSSIMRNWCIEIPRLFFREVCTLWGLLGGVIVVIIVVGFAFGHLLFGSQ